MYLQDADFGGAAFPARGGQPEEYPEPEIEKISPAASLGLLIVLSAGSWALLGALFLVIRQGVRVLTA